MNMARSIINNQSCSSGKVRVMVLAGLIPACAQMTDVANDHETWNIYHCFIKKWTKNLSQPFSETYKILI